MNTLNFPALSDRLRPLNMGLEIICYRYADDYWDEALRGAGCIYIVKCTEYEGVYSDSWPVYFMADGSWSVSKGLPAEAAACLQEWIKQDV